MSGLMTFFSFVFIMGQIIAMSIEGGGMASTSLTIAIDNDDAVATVSSTAGFLSASGAHPAYVAIDNEVVTYTGKTDTTLTGLTRAVDNPQSGAASTAVAHAIGSRVLTLNITALDSFMGYNLTTSEADFGALDAIKLSGQLFKNLPRMLAWDYPWLSGHAVILRFPLFALSAGFVFAVGMAMLGLAQSLWRAA